MRLNPAEIDKVATNPSHEVEYGSTMSPTACRAICSGTAALRPFARGDGRLWLATRAGASVIDPGQLPRIHRPAPPRIDRVVVDGRPLPVDRHCRIARRTSNLQVDYGTLSLSAATKLRYRYMLEGVNTEWVDAGAARQATFANVPSGPVPLPRERDQRRPLDRGAALGFFHRAAVLQDQPLLRGSA